MPARLQAPSGVDVAVWHEPSEDLGGECYDAVSVLAEDGKTVRCMVLAMFDFPGAGVAAAVYGSQLRGAFRAGVRDGLELNAQAARLDALVRGELPAPGPLHVTLLRLDAACTLEVLGLGDGAVLLRQRETVTAAVDNDTALGLEPAQPIASASERQLDRGDLVVLVSDGVLDALDERRQRYGLSGIERTMRAFKGSSAEDFIDCVRRDLEAYDSGPRGDRTLLAILVQG
jgi:serine phosphatase RsbU (regulator of sigma subunit)